MSSDTLPASMKEEALPELPAPFEPEWPTLNPHALGCGIEDRGWHDRYECAEYGWQEGVDRAAQAVPEEIYTADQMRTYALAARAGMAPAKPVGAAWQPIETAPKDGTEILGYTTNCGALVLYWDTTSSEEDHWSDGMSHHRRDPTLWQSIPAAPTRNQHDRYRDSPPSA